MKTAASCGSGRGNVRFDAKDLVTSRNLGGSVMKADCSRLEEFTAAEGFVAEPRS
jgi:hypothetical protein